MRMPFVLATLSLALAPPALAQRAPAEPVFSAQAMEAHVDFLADDLLEGRNAGTRGHEIAAHYVAAQFALMGLKPAGENGSWFQWMTLSSFELDPAKPASVTIDGRRLENGKEVLIGASPRAGAGTQSIAGGVVFAGFGLEGDYAGLDVKGKLVAVLMGAPRELTGEAAQAAAGVNKGAIAGKHGAAGVLYLIGPHDARRFPWAQASAYFLRPQSTWLGPNGAPGGTDPGVATGAYLNAEAATALFAGAPRTAAQVFDAAEKPNAGIKGFPLKAQAVVERTNLVRNVRTPNVLGMLPGADARLKDETVLLMAHLDHEGKDEKRQGDQIYNGAMDNAVGTAAMLEAARGFAQSGVRPKRSILFAAVTAEEDGLLGSEFLSKHPVPGTGKVVGVVNLDMPVLLYDFKDVVAFGAEHSTLGPIVERAAGKAGVTLSPDPMPEENLFVRSDHYSFVKAGVPSVFLVTGFQNGGEAAFREFLKTHYHKVSDQTDLPFNWQAGAKFARINYLIALEIANAAQAPRWYEGNQYGDRYAPGQPRAPKPAIATAPAAAN